MGAIYQKAKNFRLLNGVPFIVTNVYPAYRSGGVEVGGKFIGKSFYSFPKENGEGNEFREKIWDKEAKEFRFVTYTGKLDKEFFATYKKVYDVEVELARSVNLHVWDKESRSEVPTAVEAGEKVVFQAISASKIKTMVEDMDLDGGVVLVDGKDKAGNPSKVKPFDWEDGCKELLVGVLMEMKVRGEGMDTKYSFKEPKIERKARKEEEVNLEDIPF